MSTPIEQKEIRGITAKHIMWLIGVLCSILISVIGTYYSTVNKINSIQKDVSTTQDNIREFKGSKDLQDAQIKALNLNMQVLEIRIVKLETQLGIQSERNNFK
jgi:uncharacterized membrane protein (DUF106 family)